MDAFSGVIAFDAPAPTERLAREATMMLDGLRSRLGSTEPPAAHGLRRTAAMTVIADDRAAVAILRHPDRPLIRILTGEEADGPPFPDRRRQENPPAPRRWALWLGHPLAAAPPEALLADPVLALLAAGSDFAVVAWDPAQQTLFLARDPLGYRPVWGYRHANTLLFASDPAALFAHPAFRPRLGPEGLNVLFALGPYRPPEHGLLEDVFQLRPGTYRLENPAGTKRGIYWSLAGLPPLERPVKTEEAVEAVLPLLRAAVRRAAGGDVTAAFLSGGLDSSALVALLAEIVPRPVETFSVEYEDNERFFRPTATVPERDTPYIGEMVRHAKSRHTTVVLDADALLGALERSLWARGLPGMADIDAALILFAEAVAQSRRAVLSGEGADELFGGYPWTFDPEARALAAFPWAKNIDRRLQYLRPDVRAVLAPDAYLRASWQETLLELAPPAALRALQATPDGGPEAEEARLRLLGYVNLTRWGTVLLERKDRMTRLFGIDARLPFLDRPLVEAVWRLPWSLKVAGGRPKALLREALAGIVPASIRARRKSPFPKTFHPRFAEGVRALAEARLRTPEAPLWTWIDRDAFARLIATFPNPEPFPWFGQLLDAPGWVAYLLAVDRWLDALRPSVRL
ncbi:asparagine synthase-related protein [Hydrogenibacillus schlegelii]|uniref:asparagine synthase (glutamine-hydrolyzing) n=1 Tax=Hydrogenibacillus schlegelii TaxID=1484 RepID=A0A179ILF6_HYDSH|nr:asparagine synthase-related protein [Hydrogenibacillus schlegelii]OAR03506.1 hypothetical protein SA87_02340 [Hydrogenibacillus schlegelii]